MYHRAFSLIELLVVLSLIALLIGLIGSVQPQSGQPLNATQRITAAMVKAARSEALLRNSPTRLLIHQAENNNKPCFLGIVSRQGKQTEGESEAWIAIHEGVTLPQTVYFESKISAEGNKSLSLPKMRFAYPSFDSPGSGKQNTVSWFYCEFSSDGRLTQGRNQRFRFTKKTLPSPKNSSKGEQKAGFLIHTSGHILPEMLSSE